MPPRPPPGGGHLDCHSWKARRRGHTSRVLSTRRLCPLLLAFQSRGSGGSKRIRLLPSGVQGQSPWPSSAKHTEATGMTGRRYVLSGSSFEREVGYARAVVDGDWVFVSGTTGFDYASMTIVEDVGGQAAQALKNIGAALAEAGAGFADVVRVRYILPDRAEFEACWPLLRACFAGAPPAATMMVAGLADPRMKIEIEVTARRRSA